MISRVIVAKKLISEFRRAAQKAYPNELLRTLWGRIQGDSVIINSIRDVVQKGTPDKVSVNEDDIHSTGARENYLGTIHSHPDSTDASPSVADWQDSFASGEHVFGVMKISKEDGRFRTQLGFWEPRPEIAVIYPRTRKPNAQRKSEPVDACGNADQRLCSAEVRAV